MADRPLGKKKIVLVIIGMAITVAGIGLITWKLLVKENPTVNSTQATNPATSQPSAQTSDSDIPSYTTTKEYENGLLALKLDYPDTWKISESENKDGVRIESPDFTYTTLDKGQVKGNFRIYIRKGARSVDSKYIGRGVAESDSVKLVYSKPTPGQRAETYLSNFGLDETSNFAFFLIAGNFNLKKGDTLGPNYGKEFDTYIIAGGYTDASLKDDLATHTVPASSYANLNAYKQAVDILKSIQVR